VRSELELLFVDQSMQWAGPFAFRVEQGCIIAGDQEASTPKVFRCSLTAVTAISRPGTCCSGRLVSLTCNTIASSSLTRSSRKNNDQKLSISPYPFPAGGDTLGTKRLHLYKINVFCVCKATLNLSSKYLKHWNILKNLVYNDVK